MVGWKNTCDDDGVCPGRSELQRHLMLVLVDSEVVLVRKPLHKQTRRERKTFIKVELRKREQAGVRSERKTLVKLKQITGSGLRDDLSRKMIMQPRNFFLITFTVNTGQWKRKSCTELTTQRVIGLGLEQQTGWRYSECTPFSAFREISG